MLARRELGNYQMPAERELRAERLAAVYAATHREFFLFATADGRPAGWATGAMIDASTFFMAWTVVLPEFRRRGLYAAYLAALRGAGGVGFLLLPRSAGGVCAGLWPGGLRLSAADAS